MSRPYKLVTHLGYLQVKRVSGRVSTNLCMLFVLSHHIAKQFRMCAMASNNIHFLINFSRKINLAICRSATKNKINIWQFHLNRNKNVFGTSCSNI